MRVVGLGGWRNSFAAFEQLERDADDVRVFRREFPGEDAAFVGRGFAVLVVALEVITLPAQRASGNLFAKELRAEFTDAADVRDRVRIPAFGEHGNGDDAADVRAERVAFADGVDDFAQDLGIFDAFGRALAVNAGVFLLEAFDLRREHALELVVNLPGVFQRVAVNQQGRRLCGVAGLSQDRNWRKAHTFRSTICGGSDSSSDGIS